MTSQLWKNSIFVIHLKTHDMKFLKAGICLLAVLMLFAGSSCKKSSESAHLVSPANRTVNVPLNQTFTCSAPSNATTFEFMFSDLTNPAGGFQSGILIVPTYTPTSLVSGHTYTWTVHVTTTDMTLNTDSWTFSTQ